MPRQVIKLSGYSEYLTGVFGERLKGAMQRGLISGTARCIAILQEATQAAPPANPAGVGEGGAFDTGGFFRRWRSTVVGERLSSWVYNDHPASEVIEDGRRPGARRPPLKVIARWAQRRLGLSQEDARAAAFPIASEIARRGLLGRRILWRSLGRMGDVVRQDVDHELELELRS